MIDLKLSGKRLGNHLHYYAWRYVVFIGAALFAANLLFSVTKPQIPFNQKVDIYLYGNVASTDTANAWEQEMLRILPPDQKSASIFSTPVLEGQDIYSIATARLSAGDGTILILPSSLFQGQVGGSAFLPLDNLLSGLNLPKGIDLSGGRGDVQPDENKPAETHIYGIPLDGFKGLGGLFDPTGMVLALPFYADKNLSSALTAVNWLLSKTEAPSVEEPSPSQFQLVIASSSLTTGDVKAWEKEQQGKFSPEMAIKLMPYAFGRESLVAEDLIASRANKPGLCVVSRDVFLAMARAGALTPLDDVATRLKPPEGTDLSQGKDIGKTTGKEPFAERLYGIPLDQCMGLTAVFNPHGMFVVFPAKQGESLSSAIDVANWLMAKTQP